MIENLPLYLLAVLSINLLPGPDMLYIISQSISRGRQFGLAAALGICAGCFVHIFAVSIGLSSLLFESAFAFTIVKYVGTAYLLYLGISSLLKKHTFSFDKPVTQNNRHWHKVLMQGFLINVLNPKVALFFLAFLPQFVLQTSTQPIWMQLLILGLIFNFLGTIVNSLVAFFFGAAKLWIATHPWAMKIQQKITGIILIGFGLRLAAFEKV